VSIVVRSYNRLACLCELLELLLAQEHDSFEVVVVEQSTETTPAETEALAALERDPRLRVLRHPPLGGARARNVGAGAARGEFLLFIDDDDLPVGRRWIQEHLRNYEDPACLGVSGRHENHPGEEDPYGRRAERAYRRCQCFSPVFKMPWTYVRQTRRKVPVDAVHGTNGSIRRAALQRFGGWDIDTRIEDEASFGYRAARRKEPQEYFCFDPVPLVRRRLDVRGGLDKRFKTAGKYYRQLLGFVQNIIGRYYPVRVVLLYPGYLWVVYVWTLDWIWNDAQRYRSTLQRVGAAAGLLVTIPGHALACLVERLRG
jgi:glycosyltransferase involved in cell wall biosynthesis